MSRTAAVTNRPVLRRPASTHASWTLGAIRGPVLVATLALLWPAGDALAVQQVESLVATPSLVFVNTPTTIRFTARVAPDPDLISSSGTVLRLNADGSRTVIARLYDDGTNGDAAAGDMVFTAEVRLQISAPSAIRYQVSFGYLRTIRRVFSEIVIVRTELAPFFRPSDPAAIVQDADGARYPTNEVLIGLATGQGMATAEAIATSVGGSVVGFAPSGNLYQLLVPTADAASVRQLMEKLRGDSRVVFVGRNTVIESVVQPGTVKNDAQQLPVANRIAYDQISAFTAWDLLFDTEHVMAPVVVGVLDAGFQSHGEFAGVPFVNSTSRPDAGWPATAGCSAGSRDHGTAVAGLIGAANAGGTAGSFQTNGILSGVTGTAATGRVPYKLSARNVLGSAVSEAVHVSLMVASGAKVINLSYGGTRKTALPVNEIIVYLKPDAPSGVEIILAAAVGGSVAGGRAPRFRLNVPAATESEAEVIAATLRVMTHVQSARPTRDCFGSDDEGFDSETARYRQLFASHPDVIFVIAAGNETVDIADSFPGNINRVNVITVGATNASSDGGTAKMASFSNRGAGVDIAAPGEDVYAPTDYSAPLDAGDYGRVSGTSFSAPITSGAIALMLATDESLKPDRLRKILLATGTKNASVDAIGGSVLNLGSAIAFLLIPVDVFLIVDTSGSFGDDLSSFKAEANSLVTELDESGLNVHVGLGRFQDYPIEPWGSFGDKAYQRVLDVQSIEDPAGNRPIIAAIGSLFASGGFDGPESQLVALYQAATGAGQTVSGYPAATIPVGQGATFRDAPVAALEPVRIVVLWTDFSFHTANDSVSWTAPVIGYPGPTFSQTTAALNAKGIRVIGISGGGGGAADLRAVALATGSVAPAEGVDCDADGLPDVGAGQPIVCSISTRGTGIGDAIFGTVLAAVKDRD
jgi:hypothetical protein